MVISSTFDQVAVLADIHGNIWALDAVLADIARRGVTRIINLGDSLYGSLDPKGIADRLMAEDIPSIWGNQDRIVLQPTEAVRHSSDYQFIMSQLEPAHLAWLEQQSPTWVLGDIFCCHGTPASDETYLLEQVTPQGVFLQTSAHILSQLGDVQQPVIVCGHSHVPRTVWLPSGQLVVNPGSVGIPAYTEDLPYPHVMEAGSPHARYAILSHHDEGWSVEHIAVAYPWQQAASVARQRGRPDRAAWIETGRASLGIVQK